jgi:hypothetical protein
VAGRITELTALTGAAAATTDLIETVDVSDTSMAGTGTNKKMTLAELVTFLNANGVGGGGGTPVGTKLSALTAMGSASAVGDLLEVVDISDTTMAASGTNKKLMLSELRDWLIANGITVADNAITLAKMADGSVGTAEIIDANVTNAKLAQMPGTTIKGNTTGSNASPVDLSVYQTQGMLRRPIIANSSTAFAPVVATHENTMVTLSNASPVVVTLPSDATSAFPIGAEVDFLWLGVGACSFAQGSSATIVSAGTSVATPAMRIRYSAATAKKIAANTWLVVGNLA